MTKIAWMERGAEKIVESIDELDKILDHLTIEAEQGKPFIVELVADSGNVMGIGLGQSQTVLNFMQSSLQPPYFTSLNREFSGSNDDMIVFDYFGTWTEFPIRNAIPIQEAREALRRFFAASTLPNNVEWEEV